jgi:hypothetical protein
MTEDSIAEGNQKSEFEPRDTARQLHLPFIHKMLCIAIYCERHTSCIILVKLKAT